MANLKISQLTATTTNDIGSWVVINNSGETTSNKSQLEYVLGLTKGSGNSSIKSNDFLTDLPSESSSDYSIALGNGASASTAPSIVAIGNGAYAVSENCVVIGKNAHDQGTGRDDGIAIGTDAEIYQARAISIGKNAAGVTDAITIGTNGRAIGTNCVAIGSDTVIAGNEGVGIGKGTFQADSFGTVIGNSSLVWGNNSVTIGYNSKTGNSNGTASANSVTIGSESTIGDGTNAMQDCVNIGYNNDLLKGDRQIVIGTNNVVSSTGTIIITNDGLSTAGNLENSNEAIIIGGSGLTFTSSTTRFGSGNIKIGGIDENFTFTPGANNTFIGGKDNNWNPGGGFGQFNVFLGISGRTITAPSSNTTYVEKLNVFRQISQGFTTYTGTSIQIDVSEVGYANVNALSSGSTYTISVEPAPNQIGTTLTLFVEYQDGATIAFNPAGSVQWRWDQSIYGGAEPSFSATTGNVSRSIIVLNTWDGNDMWEVSRSMNME
jgi:hypothetical protein